ncbi:AcrR family transcriptional regulator [Mycetocola sp. BIGb0189]|uniref:TetR/AcrR family transcriptional regulator n=1 Tax=Mycetocola sp. BIGb0189 TaxID=2940604 RepID=UPI002167AFD5|nr:TetR/AcrR family transcriptional regulator [Mycetocola sp. BIGb0189]MCS4277453.1 AcrR family transcriptional regulator [Mycetocola sp. BIGb0189]
MDQQSKPDQIIEAYVDLLVVQGVRSASIDAIAKRSGLSKAGLLHHFRSRDAMDREILDRLEALVTADAAAMRIAPEGAARYYVGTSLEYSSPLERLVVAATRLGQAGNNEAWITLRWARDRWFEVLVDSLGDETLARLVLLAGDGIAYHTDIIGEESDPFLAEASITAVADLIGTLGKPPTA